MIEEEISLFLHIGQGAGLSGATGVRPFLPTLCAGALASAHVGINFDHSPYSFVGGTGFLLAVFALAIVSYGLERWRGAHTRHASGEAASDGRADALAAIGTRVLLAVSLVLGALLFAATVTTSGEVGLPALVAGVVCAGIGFAAVAALFARARRRLDPAAAKLLSVYGDLAALAVAAVAIFAPPLSFVALAALAFVAIRVRRSASQKYEGLRILR